MSMKQHFVIKAIMEANPLVGAASSDIAKKFKMTDVPQVVYSLRQRGHNVVTTLVDGIAYYSLPFGTRDQEAKLTAAQKANIELGNAFRSLVV
jgi:hypothetical protein